MEGVSRGWEGPEGGDWHRLCPAEPPFLLSLLRLPPGLQLLQIQARTDGFTYRNSSLSRQQVSISWTETFAGVMCYVGDPIGRQLRTTDTVKQRLYTLVTLPRKTCV